MKNTKKALSLMVLIFSFPPILSSVQPVSAFASPFINEIHYDNSGTDIGEAIEIAGPVRTDLSGFSLYLYNGSDGSTYDTISLSGIIPDQQSGFGTLYFSTSLMQNGPDGIVLYENYTNSVVQFLSYEGSFSATGGVAEGLMSKDIGVEETTSTLVGYSLQLAGTGLSYAHFTWELPDANTFGSINNNQTFGPSAIPIPTTFFLLGSGIVALIGLRRP